MAQPTAAKPVKKARVSPVHATVNMEIEIVDDPDKPSPAWGYIRPFVLGVALNKAFEPTQSALVARDFAQIRWWRCWQSSPDFYVSITGSSR